MFVKRKLSPGPRGVIFRWVDTPRKITMEPENHLFEKENHLPNLQFFLRFHVDFPECTNIPCFKWNVSNANEGTNRFLARLTGSLLHKFIGSTLDGVPEILFSCGFDRVSIHPQKIT